MNVSYSHIVKTDRWVNEARINVWKQQEASFFEQAIIDVDDVLVATTGECKQDMDITYKGSWGYHPLLISLANTKEVLGIVNRSGSVHSAHNAAAYLNNAILTCLSGGFKSVRMRGDCKFMLMTSVAWNLKAWTALLIPVEEEHEAEHRAEKKRLMTMEFRTFQTAIIQIPCQIIRHARQTIHRLLNWNDYSPAFFRLCKVLKL